MGLEGQSPALSKPQRYLSPLSDVIFGKDFTRTTSRNFTTLRVITTHVFKGKNETARVSQGPPFHFQFDFSYSLFGLHHYLGRNGVAMTMLIESVCPAQGGRAVGLWASTRTPARRKKTSKNLKTEHIYFSDSNYFVWKTVNTITLTTELGGFGALTQCFPSRRAETAQDPSEGPTDPGGSIWFQFFFFFSQN